MSDIDMMDEAFGICMPLSESFPEEKSPVSSELELAIKHVRENFCKPYVRMYLMGMLAINESNAIDVYLNKILKEVENG